MTGHIADSQGHPQQFVAVSLVGPGRYMAMTTSEGTFTIQNVIAGNYTVTVRKEDRTAEFSRNIDGDDLQLVVDW